MWKRYLCNQVYASLFNFLDAIVRKYSIFIRVLLLIQVISTQWDLCGDLVASILILCDNLTIKNLCNSTDSEQRYC